MQQKQCGSCRYLYEDDRDTVYRRGRMYFCRCSPFPMSRQYKVGEGSRVAPDLPACPRWAPKDGGS